MADMAFHRLLGEVKLPADLAIHKAVCDQLQHLELAARWRLILIRLTGAERNHIGAG